MGDYTAFAGSLKLAKSIEQDNTIWPYIQEATQPAPVDDFHAFELDILNSPECPPFYSAFRWDCLLTGWSGYFEEWRGNNLTDHGDYYTLQWASSSKGTSRCLIEFLTLVKPYLLNADGEPIALYAYEEYNDIYRVITPKMDFTGNWLKYKHGCSVYDSAPWDLGALYLRDICDE